jgi:hypothetical protein
MQEKSKSNDIDAIAFKKVSEEVDALLFGKGDMSMLEFEDIRDYARKRTDLYKDEKDLTPEQRAWKGKYVLLSSEMEKVWGKEKIENINNSKTKIDNLNFAKEKIGEQIELAREIEANFFLQWSIITMNDEPKENPYKFYFNKTMDKILKDKTLTSAERIHEANQILENAKIYREKTMKMLHAYHDSIYAGLTKYEALLETPFFKAIDKNVGGSNDKEWLKLSWDLYKNRTGAITGINRNIDFDEYMANNVIKKQGQVGQSITAEEKKEFAEKLAYYGYPRELAYKFMKDIEPKRVKISEACFGKLNDYIKDTKLSRELQKLTDERLKNKTLENTTANSSKPKKGFWGTIFK